MIFKEQSIKGVYLIKKAPFADKRGIFLRNFCKKEFKKYGIDNHIAQINISQNFKKGTLRGFHYQLEPFGESKTITCINGKVYDIVVDLRKKSKTYLKWCKIILSSKYNESIHIPKGCANAFLTLEDNSILTYTSSQYYSPSHERGIKFDDKLFKFKWPIKITNISVKDKNHPNFIK